MSNEKKIYRAYLTNEKSDHGEIRFRPFLWDGGDETALDRAEFLFGRTRFDVRGIIKEGE